MHSNNFTNPDWIKSLIPNIFFGNIFLGILIYYDFCSKKKGQIYFWEFIFGKFKLLPINQSITFSTINKKWSVKQAVTY